MYYHIIIMYLVVWTLALSSLVGAWGPCRHTLSLYDPYLQEVNITNGNIVGWQDYIPDNLDGNQPYFINSFKIVSSNYAQQEELGPYTLIVGGPQYQTGITVVDLGGQENITKDYAQQLSSFYIGLTYNETSAEFQTGYRASLLDCQAADLHATSSVNEIQIKKPMLGHVYIANFSSEQHVHTLFKFMFTAKTNSSVSIVWDVMYSVEYTDFGTHAECQQSSSYPVPPDPNILYTIFYTSKFTSWQVVLIVLIPLLSLVVPTFITVLVLKRCIRKNPKEFGYDNVVN